MGLDWLWGEELSSMWSKNTEIWWVQSYELWKMLGSMVLDLWTAVRWITLRTNTAVQWMPNASIRWWWRTSTRSSSACCIHTQPYNIRARATSCRISGWFLLCLRMDWCINSQFSLLHEVLGSVYSCTYILPYQLSNCRSAIFITWSGNCCIITSNL